MTTLPWQKKECRGTTGKSAQCDTVRRRQPSHLPLDHVLKGRLSQRILRSKSTIPSRIRLSDRFKASFHFNRLRCVWIFDKIHAADDLKPTAQTSDTSRPAPPLSALPKPSGLSAKDSQGQETVSPEQEPFTDAYVLLKSHQHVQKGPKN